jgi:dTDP-4-amino-4,6-dideoxygalactose transaminase
MYNLERQEIDHLKELGYKWDNLFDIIKMFENKISKYTGAPYVTVTDCCTHALELSFRYLQTKSKIDKVLLPAYTYLSVPMMLKKIGIEYDLLDKSWKGYYYFEDTNVIDMAIRFTKDCYVPGSFSCLSFGHKKVLKILRGGAIMTDNKEAHEWLQKARYDGRDITNLPWHTQDSFDTGYHYNLSVEDCARGIILMDELSKNGYKNSDSMTDAKSEYPNLSNMLK